MAPNRWSDEQLPLTVLDALAEGVVVQAADGRVLACNPAAERILGLPLDGSARIPPPAWELVWPDGSPAGAADLPWRQALDTGESVVDRVIGLRRHDGAVSWLSVSSQPTATRGERATVSTFADITTRIEAQRALADSETRFRTLAAVTPVGIFLADADGFCTYTNEHWQAIYGITAQQAAAHGWARAIHPADRAWVLRRWMATAAAGTPFEADFRIGTVDAPERWVLSRAVPLAGTGGALTGWVGVVEDVTERRAAAEARISAAFDASPIGIAIVERSGLVRAVNPALCELTGRSAAELRGAGAAALVAAEEADNLRARLRDVADGPGTRAELELRVVRADGEVRWVLVHLARLADLADGAPTVICQLLDMTERHRFEEQLRHVADHDSLTGLLNRRSFEAALAAHCAHVARYGAQGALLVLDVDHFKLVNDSLGHQAGDLLIANVAALVRDRLRASDTVARLGGDEFAALLPHATAGEADAVAVALLDAVRQHPVPLSGAGPRAVTVSIGVALFDPPDRPPVEVLAAADLAMFAAKEAGRDRRSFAPGPDVRRAGAPVRASGVDRIQSAVDEGRFTLLAQPIVSLHTGLVAQFELFVRLVDGPELVTPERFLYLAERVDLVSRIDAWVLRRAVQLLVDRPGEPFDVTVNLAQKSLTAAPVLALLSELLGTPAFDPARLVLEVGERAAMASVASTQQFLDHVAPLGCRTSLDDFGAGLGSLSYLKFLPFDFLKIDGAVVATCATSAVDRTIVSAIAAVAGELGKRTVAEATPDRATLDLLRRAGVDYAQGYYVGRPRPLDVVFPAGAVAVTGREPG